MSATTCSRCGAENPAGAQFCMRCGAPLARRCPNCGAENPQEAHFCLRCGTPLRDAPAAERRRVTVLFADLVGSTRLTASLDPEPLRALIADFFAQMREEVERHSGVVEKFIGDAVMAIFGLPVAHEDDPERAVRAALAMRQRLQALRDRRGADLHLRIGIATGEVVADPGAVGGGQFLATGEAVNLAARLQQQAPPDAIVIDERTCTAARGAVDAVPLPPIAEGDFAGLRRWAVEALAEARKPKRLRAALLGREGEMQFLQAVYRRVAEARRAHLVTMIGPAGVGKSRLADEFLASVAALPEPPDVLRGRCPAYGGGLTYWPLAEMLKQEFRVHDADSGAVVAERLLDGVRAVCAGRIPDEECEAVAATLAPLLGVELPRHEDFWGERLQALRRAVESRAAAMENPAAFGASAGPDDGLARAWRLFVAARAAARPLILVFEDLHWAEQSLLDLLEHAAARGADAPVLTLCLARPDLLERYPQWGARVRNYTAVSLAPLPEALGRRLITDLLGGEAVPRDVREAILAKAEGNPFFIEEILRMLIDTGSLVRDDGGWRWAAAAGRPGTGTPGRAAPDLQGLAFPPAVEIRIPDTIHGLLASRLDLLSPLEKRIVQDAAVIGRTFWPGALQAISGLSLTEITTAVERLQEREVVEERASAPLAGEREFAFNHALIREVAYSTLPKAQRSANHLRFAGWLEAAAGGNDEFLEVLAHHYEQAWRYRFETGERDEGLARRAIAALRRAAARASALRTLPEAGRLYERALAVLENAGLGGDVALRLELLTERCDVVKWMSAPDVVLEDTGVILALAPTIGREDLLARAWLNRAFAEYTKNRLDPAEEAIRRALEFFRQQQDRRGEAEALEVLGFITEDLRGKLTKAHTAFRQALALYQDLGDGQGMARVMARLGRSLLDNGRLADARDVLAEALRLAREHREPLSKAYALTGMGIVAHLTGDDAAAEQQLTEAVHIRRDLGNHLAEAYARLRLGMHHLRVGRLDAAETQFKTARTLRREAGAAGESALVLRGLAELYLARGDLLAAAEHAEQALDALLPTDLIAHATHRATLGKIRAAQGRREEAEALFGEAIPVLERREYPIDLALAVLKYGEALLLLGDAERALPVLERAHGLFAEMGATRFARIARAHVDSLARPVI